MPASTSASSSTATRGSRRPAPSSSSHAPSHHASRRASNLSTLSTVSNATDSSRGSHQSTRGSSAAANRSLAASMGYGGVGATGGGHGESSSLLHSVNVLSTHGGGGNAIYEEDDVQFYELQLFAYRLIYVFQGLFLGLVGPSLSYFSKLAMDQAGLNSPVSSFGPIFAAHGGAALLMSFMSELVLSVSIEMDIVKNVMVGLLLFSGAWYACLPAVAAATGNLGVSVYFIAKGFWTALLNISLNRCVLWVAGDSNPIFGRQLVTSMNFAYGFGTVLGPAVALVLDEFQIELRYAYYGLGLAQLVPLLIVAVTPAPRALYGRDQNQTLLAFEDPTRRVPTVPSPIVGGVFLHVKHIDGSAKCNPDTYDALNNLIILLVTIFATVLFGIQLGLAAFLFDYVGHVLTMATHPLPNEDVFVWGCVLMMLFWSSLWLSYVFFSKYMFHALNLFSIFYLSIVCMVSSFGILFGAEAGFTTFVICLVCFGFALAPLFTLSIHCLTRVIDELLIRRVSSLIVFGCGMGEIFLPVTMGFFMGNYSGQTYGSVAVSYILFMLSLCLVGVSTMLLMMVRRKVAEIKDNGISGPTGGLRQGNKRGSTSSSYQRGAL